MRWRGIAVCVDTARSAEFDIANLRLSERQVAAIEKSFRDLPDAAEDTIVADVRVRRFGEVDVGFVVTRLAQEVVVTIVSVRRVKDGRLAEKLRLLKPIAMIRGAFGF